MGNCAKYTRGAMGHIMKHYERAKDEKGEYIKFKNENIDISKSHLNYNLAPNHNQLDFIQNRLKEVSVLKRKDVNVMCSWVITAPKELPKEYHREFFERTYNFLKERYNDTAEKNIISSWVHNDEVTPHMHFAFIPITYDKKKEKYKVSAKEIITQADLKSFHTDFQKEMNKFVEKYNNVFECSVLNGATANGNKTIVELLEKDERESLNDLMHETDSKVMQVEKLKEQIADLEKIKNDLENKKKDILGELVKIKSVYDRYNSLSKEQKLYYEEFIKTQPEAFSKFLEGYLTRLYKAQEDRFDITAEDVRKAENKALNSIHTNADEPTIQKERS